ncbi:MAG: hypothetical protein JSV38_08800 [Desulfobacterales bacterium]|nr:MAG: hypothetical protein JSV38_08800 [Desulfobacterales bacterium]
MKRFRHIRRLNGAGAIIIVLVMMIAAMVLATTLSCSSMEEGKALFEAKCGTCHPLDYSFQETNNLAEWNKITKTMARYSEGKITEKEAKKIAKYLANI